MKVQEITPRKKIPKFDTQQRINTAVSETDSI